MTVNLIKFNLIKQNRFRIDNSHKFFDNNPTTDQNRVLKMLAFY